MKTKKIKIALIAFLLMIIGYSDIVAQSAVPHANYGVWNRGANQDFDPSQDSEYDFLVGVTVGPAWEDIEKSPGQYDWSEMDDALDLAKRNGQLVGFKINVGPQAPSWIYNNNLVTSVFTTGHKFSRFPYYLDEDYQDLYFGLIDAFAEYYYGLSDDDQDVLAFLFPQIGATGDEVPYKGNLTQASTQYDLTDGEWEAFRQLSWTRWRAAFRDGKQRPIPFLFNDLVPGKESWDWVIENIGTDFGIKNSNAYVRGHHLNKEKDWYDRYHDFLIDPQTLALFNRAEMDQSFDKPIYAINPRLGFYWGAISGLNLGLSVWDVTSNALEFADEDQTGSIKETFRFFNKYAGQVEPATSKRAFIVLHEGLNSADTDKFPETAQFGGEAKQKNKDRYEAICNAEPYASRGAILGDKAHSSDGQVDQRKKLTAYNDAGWNIWPTNYARFITQVNPDAQSVGLFRIGGEIDNNSSIYSRFARAFESSSNRNAMNFNMHDDFFSAAAGTVKFTIVYYDDVANSTWELRYDNGGNQLAVAQSFQGTGSKTWKTVSLEVNDADMTGNGIDFALVNTDNKDDIFHRIEVEHMSTSSDNVAITSPNQGDQFTVDTTITVRASGADAQGIEKMSFSVDNGSFSDDTTSPYAQQFNDLSLGEHVLNVQMTDTNGNTTNAQSVTITVIERDTGGDDFVTITSPTNGDIFTSGSNVTVTAIGEAQAGIDKMRFRINGANYINDNEAPYAQLFENLASGTYTIDVQMKDNDGNRTNATAVNITVQNQTGNFVEITAPSNGASFPSGAAIDVFAQGYHNLGIEKMRFRVNEGSYFNDEELEYMHTFVGLPDGIHELEVQMKDEGSDRTQSEIVTISIGDNSNRENTAKTDPNKGEGSSNDSSLNNLDLNQINVYPTQVIDVVNWESRYAIEEITIFDLAGREVLNQKNIKTNSLDVSLLKKGIYLVIFQGEKEGDTIEKIIKI